MTLMFMFLVNFGICGTIYYLCHDFYALTVHLFQHVEGKIKRTEFAQKAL